MSCLIHSNHINFPLILNFSQYFSHLKTFFCAEDEKFNNIHNDEWNENNSKKTKKSHHILKCHLTCVFATLYRRRRRCRSSTGKAGMKKE